MPKHEAPVSSWTGAGNARTVMSGIGQDHRFIAERIEVDAHAFAQLDAGGESSLRFPEIRWSDKRTGIRWIGLGAADDLTAPSAAPAWALPTVCRRRLAAIAASSRVRPLLRYFGGIAFDPADDPHPDWTAGGRARFVLPAFSCASSRVSGERKRSSFSPAIPI